MIKTYLNLDTVEKIYHVSDIHIRNFKRHEEYRRVFETLKKKIAETSDDKSLICLTGDIVHSKTDVTPELVYQVQDLLKSLADIRPVLLIPGNHDANLNNNSRMDALTPIVDAINHPNIAYVKDSEVFKIGNITFSHWSVFDEQYTKAEDIQGDYKICLYHGSVQSAVTEIGFKLEGGKIKTSHFDGFDLTLLGDIHKFQYLNEEKTIAYPGSLIQQNHGESLEHGILVWNIKDKTSKFVEIPNDTGFYTMYVDSGVVNPPLTDLAKNMYLRVRHTNTDQNTLKQLISEVKKSHNVIEQSIQRIHSVQELSNYSSKNSRLIDVRDEQQQNDLIQKFLSKKYKLTEDQKQQIKEINAYINQQLPKLESSRNVIWNPKTFVFENMFSYGKDNSIDFTNMRGTYGIFAANASGKSTLLDALSYCIFDKCSKTNRSSQVLNSSSNTFYCKLDFELNGINYVIERDGLREKNGNVRVKVNFYYTDDLGNKVSLNGKERNDTNASIRAVLGSYEDFTLTALSAQGANSGFIDMNQKDRKELLSQFLDINVFEFMFDFANNEMKDISAVMKQYQKIDHSVEIQRIDEQKVTINKKIDELKHQKHDLELDRDSLNKRILEEHIMLQTVSSKTVNEEQLKSEIAQLNQQLLKSVSDEAVCVLDSKSTKDDLEVYEQHLEKISVEELNKKLQQLKDLTKDKNTITIELNKLNIHLSHQKDKLNKLQELEYDENCTYCMNNVFVKDAISTKQSHEDLVKQKEVLEIDLGIVEQSIQKLGNVEEDKKKYDTLLQKINDTEKKSLKLQSDLQKVQIEQTGIKQKIKDKETELDTYRKEKKKIEQNAQVQSRIDAYELEHKITENNLKKVNDDLTENLLNINSLSSKRDKYTNDLTELVKLQSKYDLYKMYSEAVHRDGVPHQLISDTIPQIQEEINTILQQLVDFMVVLHPDDKNINAYIAYDNDRYWPIELTSGMEKFVSSLAIRSSLINVSSLPRPNFIAIDEGFGALDSSNLGSIVSYFDHLKNQFKFIMIISHIDSMRDAVDHHIEINKIEGRSNVQHVS
jgi:DNA repair exonuclease SbcCD ATPase subunit